MSRLKPGVVNLSVNVNAIAYLRNRRGLPWPSVEGLSRMALDAGAHGITVHPRPDERHITRKDVPALRSLVALPEFHDREFNIEGNPDAQFIRLVEDNRPHQVTLVPDDIRQSTSDHGWDIAQHRSFLVDVIARLHASNMRVSLFVDALPAMALAAKDVGADRIEIFTGPYGGALDDVTARRELDHIIQTGMAARDAGLGLNAGHDLTRANLPALVAALPHLDEVSIGHALTGDALAFGMADTVRQFLRACGHDARR
jgi:pyridoxine 5-phosphate synthase